MTTIGNRPKGLQNFLANVKSTLSRGKKTAGSTVQGQHAGSQTSLSSDGFSTDKDKENPYTTLLPRLPRGGTTQEPPAGQQAQVSRDVFAGPNSSLAKAPPTTAFGAGLNRSNALRSETTGVSVRARARAPSGASLRTVNSATTQSTAGSSPGSFNAQMLQRASPLEELMQQTSGPKAQVGAKAGSQASGQAGLQTARTPSDDSDMWAHLG